jgi:hypothetical protein
MVVKEPKVPVLVLKVRGRVEEYLHSLSTSALDGDEIPRQPRLRRLVVGV